MGKNEKIAIITGAGKGIGFETARQLSGPGVKVILTARDVKKGSAAVETLLNEGGNVEFHQLDVTDQNSVNALLKDIKGKYGRTDILINNAGIFLDQGKAGLDADIDSVIETFKTNTLGPLRMCKAFAPLMIENNYGRIVNVSSGLSQLSDMSGMWPGYRISKTALNAVTRIIADEVKEKNITVNSVCPGWVKTDLGGSEAPNLPENSVGTIIWLATLEKKEPTGGFFRDMEKLEW